MVPHPHRYVKTEKHFDKTPLSVKRNDREPVVRDREL
jgi:hypothetical protein